MQQHCSLLSIVHAYMYWLASANMHDCKQLTLLAPCLSLPHFLVCFPSGHLTPLLLVPFQQLSPIPHMTSIPHHLYPNGDEPTQQHCSLLFLVHAYMYWLASANMHDCKQLTLLAPCLSLPHFLVCFPSGHLTPLLLVPFQQLSPIPHMTSIPTTFILMEMILRSTTADAQLRLQAMHTLSILTAPNRCRAVVAPPSMAGTLPLLGALVSSSKALRAKGWKLESLAVALDLLTVIARNVFELVGELIKPPGSGVSGSSGSRTGTGGSSSSSGAGSSSTGVYGVARGYVADMSGVDVQPHKKQRVQAPDRQQPQQLKQQVQGHQSLEKGQQQQQMGVEEQRRGGALNQQQQQQQGGMGGVKDQSAAAEGELKTSEPALVPQQQQQQWPQEEDGVPMHEVEQQQQQKEGQVGRGGQSEKQQQQQEQPSKQRELQERSHLEEFMKQREKEKLKVKKDMERVQREIEEGEEQLKGLGKFKDPQKKELLQQVKCSLQRQKQQMKELVQLMEVVDEQDLLFKQQKQQHGKQHGVEKQQQEQPLQQQQRERALGVEEQCRGGILNQQQQGGADGVKNETAAAEGEDKSGEPASVPQQQQQQQWPQEEAGVPMHGVEQQRRGPQEGKAGERKQQQQQQEQQQPGAQDGKARDNKQQQQEQPAQQRELQERHLEKRKGREKEKLKVRKEAEHVHREIEQTEKLQKVIDQSDYPQKKEMSEELQGCVQRQKQQVKELVQRIELLEQQDKQLDLWFKEQQLQQQGQDHHQQQQEAEAQKRTSQLSRQAQLDGLVWVGWHSLLNSFNIFYKLSGLLSFVLNWHEVACLVSYGQQEREQASRRLCQVLGAERVLGAAGAKGVELTPSEELAGVVAAAADWGREFQRQGRGEGAVGRGSVNDGSLGAKGGKGGRTAGRGGEEAAAVAAGVVDSGGAATAGAAAREMTGVGRGEAAAAAAAAAGVLDPEQYGGGAAAAAAVGAGGVAVVSPGKEAAADTRRGRGGMMTVPAASDDGSDGDGSSGTVAAVNIPAGLAKQLKELGFPAAAAPVGNLADVAKKLREIVLPTLAAAVSRPAAAGKPSSAFRRGGSRPQGSGGVQYNAAVHGVGVSCRGSLRCSSVAPVYSRITRDLWPSAVAAWEGTDEAYWEGLLSASEAELRRAHAGVGGERGLTPPSTAAAAGPGREALAAAGERWVAKALRAEWIGEERGLALPPTAVAGRGREAAAAAVRDENACIKSVFMGRCLALVEDLLHAEGMAGVDKAFAEAQKIGGNRSGSMDVCLARLLQELSTDGPVPGDIGYPAAAAAAEAVVGCGAGAIAAAAAGGSGASTAGLEDLQIMAPESWSELISVAGLGGAALLELPKGSSCSAVWSDSFESVFASRALELGDLLKVMEPGGVDEAVVVEKPYEVLEHLWTLGDMAMRRPVSFSCNNPRCENLRGLSEMGMVVPGGKRGGGGEGAGVCGACRVACYCSYDCQVEHLPEHGGLCELLVMQQQQGQQEQQQQGQQEQEQQEQEQQGQQEQEPRR